MSDLKDGGEPRRRWSKSAKRRIIAEALAPGACTADVARRHALNLSQLYTWCRPFRTRLPANAGGGAIIPIDIGDAAGGNARPVPLGLMSISAPSGIRIELDMSADETVLRRLIGVLRTAG
jgi:transposase